MLLLCIGTANREGITTDTLQGKQRVKMRRGPLAAVAVVAGAATSRKGLLLLVFWSPYTGTKFGTSLAQDRVPSYLVTSNTRLVAGFVTRFGTRSDPRSVADLVLDIASDLGVICSYFLQNIW